MPASQDAWIAWVRESARRNPGELPVFPAAANRMIDALSRPDVEIADLEALLSQDQGLSARLIQAANSVLYRGVTPVDTVSRAAMRLGLRETGQIAMAAAFRSLFDLRDRAEHETFPELLSAAWQDSLVGGYGARLIARELKVGDPERAFMSGMFRNVGILLALKLIAGGLVKGRLARPPQSDELAGVVERLHTQLGAEYLKQAGMPDFVVEAAARHHDESVPLTRELFELHVVRLADGVCARIGVSPLVPPEIGAAARQSAGVLGVPDEQIDYFALQLETLDDQLGELL
jgi:HD-like signal output (HDOD) protein